MPQLIQTMKYTLRFAAFACVFAITACSGVSSSVTDAFPTLSPAYAPTSVWHATKDGLRTVIHGNSFSVAPAQANKSILASLRMPAWHQAGEFVAYSKDQRRKGYRIVLIFNSRRPVSFGDACLDLDEIETGPSTGLTRVHAAFCASQRPLSEIDGTVNASGLDDPEFRRLLADTIDQLLPPRNFENDDRCNRPNC